MKFSNALIISIAAHIGLIVLLVLNFQFSSVEIKPSGAAQPKINAKAVNRQQVEQLVKKLQQDKQAQQRADEKRLDDLKRAENQAKRKRVQEEQKANEAIKRKQQAEQQRQQQEKKADELKRKRIHDEKAKKEREEAERKEKAEAERKRKQEAENRRKAKEEAERKQREIERKQKEKERQAALAREFQAQLDAEQAELESVQRQQVLSEVDRFSTLIQNKIQSNWFKPESQGECTFRIKISPGGLVLNIEVISGDIAQCDSGKRAIMRAEPLPMSKDSAAFEQLKIRTFKLTNKKDDDQ